MPSNAGKLEILLIEVCAAYRAEKERLGGGRVRSHKLTALRAQIQAYAVALEWCTHSEKRPKPDQIKATEREYMKRSKNYPPF